MPGNNKMQLPLHLNFVIILFGVILIFFVMIVWAGIFIPLAFAFVLSLALYPLCKRLEKFGLPRWLAILTLILVIVVFLTVFFALTYSNLLSFSEDFPKMRNRTLYLLERTQNRIEEQFKINQNEQLEWLNSNLSTLVRSSGGMLNNMADTATKFFTYMVLIPIYLFFMLYYRRIFKAFIHKIIDFEHLSKAAIIESQILNVVQRYMSGLFLVIIIISMMNIGGLWAIGIKHSVFFGALAGILTIIPYIGVFIGSLLPILYALVMTDSLFYPLAVFFWFQLVQSLEGNFITPNIVGSQISINPLVAIVTLLIGSTVWGIAGMILFIPLLAIIKVFLDNIPSLEPYGYLLSEGKNLEKKKRRKRWNFSWIYLWRRKAKTLGEQK